jgi:hypothetical protein
MVLIYLLQTYLVINQPVGIEVMNPVANRTRFGSGSAGTIVFGFVSNRESEKIHGKIYM